MAPNDNESDRNIRRVSDMILGPNEQALIRDETKGEISCYLGPNKTSLAGTDTPVIFDEVSKKFKPVNLYDAIHTLKTAPEGWYIVLKNPAKPGEKNEHPHAAGKLSTPELQVGKKINKPGPCSFGLWPGQMAKVLPGHVLRSNEYLIVRIYDEAAARANWKSAVVRGATTVTDLKPDDKGEVEVETTSTKKQKAFTASPQEQPKTPRDIEQVKTEELVMGQSIVIRGTEVSFYIPPTGVEVVPETGKDGVVRHVRTAVTLERLEYAILLDENGSKRYAHGPKVVFPKPTEHFVERPIKSDPEKAKAKKFRAQELTDSTGIYVKVIAPYEENGKSYTLGEELFITGRDMMIYYPRDEHAIIKFGEQELHFGIPIPKGEAKYILNKKDGEVGLKKGPCIFLADPRKEGFVQRVLPERMVRLMYPNNEEAIAFNRALSSGSTDDIYGAGVSAENVLARGDMYTNTAGGSSAAAIATPDMDKRALIRGASKTVAGDQFNRKGQFTAPKAVVLNEKYTGAVNMNIHNGYAVLLVTKTGEKRVVQGPQSVFLEYDESPQILRMSRGRPKGSMRPTLETVYLKVTNNIVGDSITIETADLISIEVQLSYRLNFTGDEPEKWFAVDDYVKFLCDNIRSRVRNAVRKLGVRDFYPKAEELLREMILGKSGGEGTKRTGMVFEENNLHVYDVEVLGVVIQDGKVMDLLARTQRSELEQTIQLDKEGKDLKYTLASETIKRATKDALAETNRKIISLQIEELENKLQVESTIAGNDIKKQAIIAELELNKSTLQTNLEEKKLARDEVAKTLHFAFEQKALDQLISKLNAEAEAHVKRGTAFTPSLIAALTQIGDTASIERITNAFGPLEVLGIKNNEGGLIQAFGKMLAGTQLGNALLQRAGETGKNGTGASSASPRA